MTKHKSAIKKTRQDIVRHERNKAYRTRYKTEAKKVDAALSENNLEAAKQAFQEAVAVFDSLARKGIIHKNKAARKKSRLAKKINALTASN